MHDDLQNKHILSMSNLVDERSNKKLIIKKKKGILSPYNILAYNLNNDYDSQKS
jgi:hypothetical protein